MKKHQSPEDRFLKAFGNSVRERRYQLGLTQEELASRAELHRTYIGDIERGARNIALNNMIRLCRALEISPVELFKKMPWK